MRKTSKKILTFVMTAMMVSFVFVGCGDTMNDATDGTTNNTTDTTEDMTQNDDTMTEDDTVGEGTKDVGDAVGDVTDGGFETYEDAHDYLLGQLGTENRDASYEIKNVKKETVEYQDGQKGYQFEVHDTNNGKDTKIGTFYVDQATGKVYKGDKNGKNVKEYTFSERE